MKIGIKKKEKKGDLQDIKKCVNEIILYLLLNNIRTKIGFTSADVTHSNELKEENFDCVENYVTYISVKIIEDIYSSNIKNIFIDDNYETEEDMYDVESGIDSEVILELKSIFKKYIPFLSLLKLEKETSIQNIILKYIEWEIFKV